MSTYNWMLCPRCRNFSVAKKGREFFCKNQPLAFTGDGMLHPGSSCPDFIPSGKRGFETKKEDHAGKQKVKQEKPAQKDQVQRRKAGRKKQDQAAEETLGPLFK